MNDIIQQVIAYTGITHEQASTAVIVVVGALKAKLPPPVATQLDTALTPPSTGSSTALGEQLATPANTSAALSAAEGLLGHRSVT